MTSSCTCRANNRKIDQSVWHIIKCFDIRFAINNPKAFNVFIIVEEPWNDKQSNKPDVNR